MLRSLFAGISGLRAHQTMLDVTGNNIANVNTTGFKSSSVQFQDTLSQVLTNAGAATETAGGTNPAQIGLGVKVAGISTNFQQGASQLTNVSTDMMISGDGFFVVSNGGEQLYTRSGAFSFDSLGRLVTADGSFVQGWAADATGTVDTNDALSDLTLPVNTLMGATATTEAVFSGNLPSDAEVGDTYTRQIDVYDASGGTHTLTLQFVNTATGDWDITADVDGTTASGTGSISFNTDGSIDTVTLPTLAADAAVGTEAITLNLDDLTGYAELETIAASDQDGQAAGNLQSFAVNADGTIMGTFSNGLKQAIGQIALASFTNPDGLETTGSSTYAATVNSGDAQVGVAGTGARGSLTSGSLEMSNVDLSAEFTNLIVAQRGFQANSRIITTSDSVLEELVNLKR
ncbi:flagellar hook protein FlgE [Demequina sp. NBRC 110054]|uniref:flagellar hook protein FlgE n=1 Tax=Demequina sp. NBRC 110054 TaxID=1570343 RepID=UPI0009FE3534|nr:flagellar hook protein FlgE [Demequina sp. NBRC 110054]